MTVQPGYKSGGGKIEIGENTYWGSDFIVRSGREDELVTIGRFCSISDKVSIFAGLGHNTQLASTWPFFDMLLDPSLKTESLHRNYATSKPTKIGNDVWIGYGAVILGGSEICDGAVVGAHSVVSGRVPPYAVVAGNRAQVVCYRFSAEITNSLLAIKWWDWSEDDLRARAADFFLPIDQFVKKWRVTR